MYLFIFGELLMNTLIKNCPYQFVNHRL